VKDCKRAVAEAGGITEAEADAIVQALGEAGRRLSAEGRALALDRELLRLAKGEADEARRAAAVARRRAAIAALKAAELRADIGRYRQEGLSPVVALKALMHGAERPVAGVRRSVWATAQAYKDRYVGGVMAAIARERPHLERQLGDEAFNERVAREMEEIGRKGGEPGVTGDADARWLAGLFARYGELSRRDRNRLGADVPARPGWTPHVHDPWRIVRAGEREWIGFTLDLLDLDRTFPGRSRKDAEDALSNVWRTIATGRDQSGPPEPGDLAGPAPGPANLCTSSRARGPPTTAASGTATSPPRCSATCTSPRARTAPWRCSGRTPGTWSSGSATSSPRRSATTPRSPPGRPRTCRTRWTGSTGGRARG
jgi:hypothetical protein